jgi:hypothetical protein
MEEFIVNLHMHTTYSDGHASHADLARVAIRTGLDAIIVTDHNVWVNGVEGYFSSDQKRVLVMIGEEIHDQTRNPQKNHLLVFGAGRELSTFAKNPQNLIDRVNQNYGLAFLAHPFEDALPIFNETDISWEDWQVDGYTGIELWNGFSEFKSIVKNKGQAIFYAFFPQYLPHGPLDRTLQKWNELLSNRQRIVAVGGSDAHALPASIGPLHRTVFPYHFHFRCINNHILLDQPPVDDATTDSRSVLDALKRGHSFIGYDLPASTRGFRFTAHARDGVFWMGDDVSLDTGVTFQIKIPGKAECSLIYNGQALKSWRDREICTYVATRPGAYRVEVHIHYLGQRRSWIYSNPIYLHE